MKICRFICVIGVSLIVLISNKPVIAQVIDGPIAHEQFKHSVQKMLYQERFGDLENMAYDLRKTKAKFPDGAWKLLLFYEGFKSPLDKTPDGWKRFLTKFDKWLQVSPDSVTARVAAGTGWAFFGWKARGSGYANSVSDEGWRLLKDRLDKAFSLLTEKPVHPEDDCPGRYDLLLAIANVQGWDRAQYEELFHEAITFEPTYHAYFLNKANYLTTKWHGEKGDWQKFAQNAGNSTSAKEAGLVYTRILMSFWPNEFKSFTEPGITWSLAKQGFVDIEKNNPGSPWNLNRFCQLACVAKDKETARELFAKIGNRPYWQAWKNDGYEQCQALLGIDEPNVLKFNPWLDTEEFRQLLQLAEEGDANAQFQIGQQYYDCAGSSDCSTDINSTFQEAIKWFKKAVEQGHVQAQGYLAGLYTSGMGGIKPNLSEAIRLNEAAAYQGSNNAAFSLAFAYYTGGSGVTQDLAKAFVWFSQMEQQHPLMKEVATRLTPEQLKEVEIETKKVSLQILKNKEVSERK